MELLKQGLKLQFYLIMMHLYQYLTKKLDRIPTREEMKEAKEAVRKDIECKIHAEDQKGGDEDEYMTISTSIFYE